MNTQNKNNTSSNTIVLQTSRYNVGSFCQGFVSEHGILLFNSQGITFIPVIRDTKVNALLKGLILLGILICLGLFFYYRNYFVLLVALLLLCFELLPALMPSWHNSSIKKKIFKQIKILKEHGPKSVKQISGGWHLDWISIDSASVDAFHCKFILKTDNGSTFEFHLYNENGIGNHPECLKTVDIVKKAISTYVNQD